MGRGESSHDGGDPGSAGTRGTDRHYCNPSAVPGVFLHKLILLFHSSTRSGEKGKKKLMIWVMYPPAKVTEAASRVPGRVSRSTGLLF